MFLEQRVAQLEAEVEALHDRIDALVYILVNAVAPEVLEEENK